MAKRIVVCADGTWNRPERDLRKDHPTNVLRISRAILPVTAERIPQQVFYDWRIGSYHDKLAAGATGRGLHKNIMDHYRYIVQNYTPGDELFLFGFSRGAYTIRSVCGLINNCGILRRAEARLIHRAFGYYKRSGARYSPQGRESRAFRRRHSHPFAEITFVGVWDTVGALGIPLPFLGLLRGTDEFYDTKIGSNIRVARHALAIDERRGHFEPTVWTPRRGIDLKQVWFVGAHGDVGGGYARQSDGTLLSDIPLAWMMREAADSGLVFEEHLGRQLRPSPIAPLHLSRRGIYHSSRPLIRRLLHGKGPVLIHSSVRERWKMDPRYRRSAHNLAEYAEDGWRDCEVEA